VRGQLIEQRAQPRLVVRQRPIDQTPTAAAKSNRMMDLAGDVDAAEDLVALVVRFHQTTPLARSIRPTMSDAPAATLRWACIPAARSLSALTNAQQSR
jgi:hypothetical protein